MLFSFHAVKKKNISAPPAKTLAFLHALAAFVGSLLGRMSLRAETPSFLSQVQQWETQEISVQSRRAYGNPSKEVNIACRFRSAGKDVLVAGFYDGNQTWKVRPMPETRGDWSFAMRQSAASAPPTPQGRGSRGFQRASCGRPLLGHRTSRELDSEPDQ